MAKRNRYAHDFLDAIRLTLEGAKDRDVAIETIEKILEVAPKAQPTGTVSVEIFVEAIRALNYSYEVNG